MVVYTLTLLDFHTDPVLGIRTTPGIFSRFHDAEFHVRNNLHQLDDGNTYQYAVIEESRLNEIRPNLQVRRSQWWYKFNAVENSFIACVPVPQLRYQTGFGIG